MSIKKLATAGVLAIGTALAGFPDDAQACGSARPSECGDKSIVNDSYNTTTIIRNNNSQTDNSVRATGGAGGHASSDADAHVGDVSARVGNVSGGDAKNNTNVKIGPVTGGEGGMGGQGGQGGAGGSSSSTAKAEGGQGGIGLGGAGGNATGGQGGVGQGGIGQGGAGGNATGGAATTGASSSNNNNNISYNSTYKAAAYAPSVMLAPSGNCGSGVSATFGVVAATGGVGYAWQGEKCLTTEAAKYLVGVGLYNEDDGVTALGIATLNEQYEPFRKAMGVVGPNLENCPQAGKVSAVLLAKPDLNCNKIDQHLRPAIQTVAVATQMFEEPKRVRRAPAPSPKAIEVPAEQFCEPLIKPLREQLQECRAGANITMVPAKP